MTALRTLLLAAAVGAVGLASPATAQNRQVLTTAVPFLQIEPDSRSAGMGMTGVALSGNAYSPFWNPASLAEMDGAQVSFTYAPWLPALGADLAYNYLTGTYGLGSAGTVGGHLTYFDLGTQIATDERGESLGEFSSYELAAGVSYGYPVTENLSVGTGARIIYSNLTGGARVGNADTDAGFSFGVDLGAKYTAPDIGLGESSRPSVAFNIANMGPRISYTEENEFPDAIPTTLRFGAALDTQIDEFNRVVVALDLNKILVNGEVNEDGRLVFDPFYEAFVSSWASREVASTAGPPCDERGPDDTPCETVSALNSLTLGTGLEYWYNDLFAMRGGYFYEDPANGNRQFLTLGTGIRYSLVGVDISYIYALQEDSPLADQLRFSLLLNIPR